MSDKYFIDTNIFIYSFDGDHPSKQAKSRELIQVALGTSRGIISTQVVQEFLNVATRKFAIPMKIDDGMKYLRLVLNPLCQVYPDLSLYETCLELQKETGFSFYDSLILAAAVRGGCNYLYSEDMQNRYEIHGVEIKNPFL